MTKPYPVKIRGKTYGSVKSAARWLGVSPSTIYCALERGTVDSVGLGPGNRTNRNGGRKRVPISIGGYDFKSYADAARALGYCPKRLRKVVVEGGTVAKTRLLSRVMQLRAKEDAVAVKAETHRQQQGAKGYKP